MTIVNENSIPTPHRCERVLTHFDLKDPGIIVQCDCGLVYEMRATGLFNGIWITWGTGHKQTRFGAIQYWHLLGRREPQ